MIKRGSYLLGLVVLLGCNKPEKLTFFEVTLSDIQTPDQLGKINLKGDIRSTLDFSEITRQGFIWSSNLQDVQTNYDQANWEEAPKDSDGHFELDIENLSLDSIYYFRAFAEGNDGDAGTRLVYSPQIETFSFNVALSILPEFTRINDRLVVTGVISGLDNINADLADHGFVYSTTETEPELPSIATHLLEIKTDGIFTDTLQGLSFNTTYYIRAWGEKTPGQPFYSDKVLTVFVGDGWKKTMDLSTSLTGAVAVSSGSKGYVAYGAIGGAQIDASKKLFEFNPSMSTASASWQIIEENIADTYSRINASAFYLNGFIYAGFGKELSTNQTPISVMLKIDPANGNVVDPGSIVTPFAMKGRSSAVSFVLNGKAYIGSGSESGDQTVLLNDFWEFDPATNNLRIVARLPLKKSPNSTTKWNEGRYEAVSFTVGEEGFVGGGYAHNGIGVLSDFWKFTIDATNPVDTGSWELVSFFPGVPTLQATAMVVKDRVYLGTGVDEFNLYTNEWWEFLPQNGMNPNAWIRRTSCPGPSRLDAVSFTAANRGFFGLGRTRVLVNDEFMEKAISDFWEYIPEE